MGESNGPPGWNLLALITRSVVQLGLAVETTSASVAPLYPSIYTLRAMVLPEPLSFIEDEQRRRLFWMVYILDRYATVATAFEFALADKEIDRKLVRQNCYLEEHLWPLACVLTFISPAEMTCFRRISRSRPDGLKPQNGLTTA